MKHVGLAANLENEVTRPLLQRIVPLLASHGVKISLDEDLAEAASTLPGCTPGIDDSCEVLIAVGGDGTILKLARRYADRDLPIVGVKGGRLGFLTENTPEAVVEMLLAGSYEVQDRMRITGRVHAGGGAGAIKGKSFSALNDVVIHSTGYSRMLTLRVEVGGKLFRELSADGVIVATPTGSTAYSLSAGGPVLEPTLDAIMLTPLNPHTMSIRPMVLDATEVVQIQVSAAPSGLMITVDGQQGIDMDFSEHVEIRRDTLVTRLVVPESYDFFARLREKL
ncbi:MAG TPA: NAD(+)/NADH kinase [Candidatus Krumholzibacteria bacterium]|nr:NAD(+)/NADH kinase [Candidatus Krumholzibacteria bacterium]